MSGARAWTGRGRGLALVFALFALLLQANAPIQSTMMALGTDVAANICSSRGGQADDHKSPLERHDACAACVVCVGAGAAVPVDAAMAPPAVSLSLIVQPLPVATLGPRGPPRRAANARAPPLQA